MRRRKWLAWNKHQNGVARNAVAPCAAATQHHYDCPECEQRFMAQDAAGLVKVGTPPEARREPERRRMQSVSLILS